MSEITRKQERLYKLLCDYWEEHLSAPTFRELSRLYGSPNSIAPVQSLLYRLQGGGYVDWEPNKPGTLRPIKWDKGLLVLPKSAIAAIKELKAKCGESGDDFAEVLLSRLHGGSVDAEEIIDEGEVG